MSIKHAIICAAFCLTIFGCVSTGPSPTATFEGPASGGAVAVWELENMTVLGSTRPDLSEILSARITETVREEGNTVVERERLLAVLKELSLGTSELANTESRLRIGHLAGAKRMVFGGYQVVGDSMRIDLRMVEVETGRVLKTSEKTVGAGDQAGWLTAAEEAARGLFR